MTSRPTLVLDLDGTILDTRLRHYTCYCQILAENGFAALPPDAYWDMKRSAETLRVQLEATGAGAIYDAFRVRWLLLIESPEMLLLDRVHPGAIGQIESWRASGWRLVLATLRQFPDSLRDELDQLGLRMLFDLILVSAHRDGGDGKAALVRASLPDLDPETTWWIGDTEVDIRGALALGCRICAVASGIRDQAYLTALRPDAVAADLAGADAFLDLVPR